MSSPMQNAQALIDKIQSLPSDRITEVEDFVDFLKQKIQLKKEVSSQKPLNFPVISVGKWPDGLSLNRENMYGSNGR